MVFLYRLLVCGGFFMHIVAFKIIFSMKRGYAYVWRRGRGGGHVKMCEFCRYAF